MSLPSLRPAATRRPLVARLVAAALFLPLPLLLGCPFKEETFERRCTTGKDCSDGNECTEDDCNEGVCSNPPKTKEVACGKDSASVCDGKGHCIECLSNADCVANHPMHPVCDTKEQTCVSCADGIKNGKETDVDCGGPDCGACLGDPCDPTNGCGNHTFCTNPEKICCSTACTDKCQACSKAKTGQPDGQCASIPFGMDPDGECTTAGGCGATQGKCRCEDGVKNADETDIDCGGAVCQGCGGGKMCMSETDCAVEVPGENPVCQNSACCETLCNGTCQTCDSTGKCAKVPEGASDPNMLCPTNTACGPNNNCLGKAGVACMSGGFCLSGVCSGTPKTCAKSTSGQHCNNDSDCASGLPGACANYICM